MNSQIDREALIRIDRVMELTGLSASNIYDRIEFGGFPQAFQVGARTVAWKAAEVLDWNPDREVGDQEVCLSGEEAIVLLTEHEIVSAARNPTACGVYFLILNLRIVYVGRSRNVFARIESHRGSKAFDDWHYILCEPSELVELEAAYITRFRPMLNVAGLTRVELARA